MVAMREEIGLTPIMVPSAHRFVTCAAFVGWPSTRGEGDRASCFGASGVFVSPDMGVLIRGGSADIVGWVSLESTNDAEVEEEGLGPSVEGLVTEPNSGLAPSSSFLNLSRSLCPLLAFRGFRALSFVGCVTEEIKAEMLDWKAENNIHAIQKPNLHPKKPEPKINQLMVNQHSTLPKITHMTQRFPRLPRSL